VNATLPPRHRDHCYDDPKPPLGGELVLTGPSHFADAPRTDALARACVWRHAVGDSPEAEQDDGLELLDALGLLGEPAAPEPR